MTDVTVLGSKSLGLAVARSLPGARIVTFDDQADGRSRLEELRGIGADVVADPRTVELETPVVIVAGWYRLLPAEQLAGRRVVGLHNSLLPRYRGGSPLVWAMIRGEHEVGVSLFELADGIDAGPIWGQATTIVGPDETIGDVLERLEPWSVQLVVDALDRLCDPAAAGAPQDEGLATWAAQRQPSDGRIDWTWSALRIHDFVRAQSRPYPGAFTELEGRPMAIWRTRRTDRIYVGSPGQVVPGGVICGDDRLLEVLDSSEPLPRFGRLGDVGWFGPVS